jgi:hypothetical protein
MHMLHKHVNCHLHVVATVIQLRYKRLCASAFTCIAPESHDGDRCARVFRFLRCADLILASNFANWYETSHLSMELPLFSDFSVL